MSTELIGHEQALKGLNEAVKLRGRDHQDPNSAPAGPGDCVYVSPIVPEPVCLAATALHLLGVSLDELKHWEGQSALAMHPSGPKCGEMAQTDPHRALVTLPAARLLSYAQNSNDIGKSWGEILDDIDRNYTTIIHEGSHE